MLGLIVLGGSSESPFLPYGLFSGESLNTRRQIRRRVVSIHVPEKYIPMCLTCRIGWWIFQEKRKQGRTLSTDTLRIDLTFSPRSYRVLGTSST